MDVGDIIVRSFLDLSLKNADPNDLALVAAHRAFIRTVCRSGHSVAIELLLNSYVRIFDTTLDPEHDIQRRWAREVLPPIGSSAYRGLVNAIERRDHDGARQSLDGAVLQLRTLMMGIIAPGHRRARPAAASQASTRKQRKPR
jgi:hypothetical protein